MLVGVYIYIYIHTHIHMQIRTIYACIFVFCILSVYVMNSDTF